MKINPARLIISGTNSGSGKTTLTCALLGALKKKNIDLASFKCGPDYIDPMFHKKVLDTPCNNLDSFFSDPNTLMNIINDYSKELSIIEGVMGYYDGTGTSGLESSTYDISKKLSTNVILVVNCKGMSTSILALIKGYLSYREDNNIKGVILNNITEKTYNFVKEKINEEFKDLYCLGYFPKLDKDLLLESRHLGLVTANEIKDIKEKLNKLADIASNTIDLDLLIKLAKENNEIEFTKINIDKIADVRIAVANDKAFNFYYQTNLDILKKLGAELIYFSPLHDKELPNNIDGLYIGGGYPELYKEQLSNNKSMLSSIKEHLDNHLPTIAECGGFMYLNKSIEDYPMVGYLKDNSYNTKKLTRFGYISLLSKEDNLILKKNEMIKAHEFHYYDVSNTGNSFIAKKTNNQEYECVIANEYLYAGYPHLYFYSNLNAAINFINRCKK